MSSLVNSESLQGHRGGLSDAILRGEKIKPIWSWMRLTKDTFLKWTLPEFIWRISFSSLSCDFFSQYSTKYFFPFNPGFTWLFFFLICSLCAYSLISVWPCFLLFLIYFLDNSCIFWFEQRFFQSWFSFLHKTPGLWNSLPSCILFPLTIYR